jgi:hypothetical protein
VLSPNNFCTLFDSGYLSRALAMYRSLEASGEDFILYAVCFDDLAYQLLQQLQLSRMVPIPLADFESPQLLAVKGQRTVGEYCWTCTSHVIRYVLDTYKLPEITYLDADLYFYAKPSLLLAEFKESNASVLITEHRYTTAYDQSATSGIYCVQFMTFKADQQGMKVLQWWQDRCIEWCYARFEDGKFGDQKYLDDWPQRFDGIHVLRHLGGGVAPWNVQQYKLLKRSNSVYVNEYPLVFYHFHGYRCYDDGVHDFSDNWFYRLSRKVVDLIYRPYSGALLKAQDELKRIYPGFKRGVISRKHTFRTRLIYLRKILSGVGNEHRVSKSGRHRSPEHSVNRL